MYTMYYYQIYYMSGYTYTLAYSHLIIVFGTFSTLQRPMTMGFVAPNQQRQAPLVSNIYVSAHPLINPFMGFYTEGR